MAIGDSPILRGASMRAPEAKVELREPRGGSSRMFRWKKRDEGFEWHKYVRTTIKLRREARREKAHALGARIAEGAKAAGGLADGLAESGAERLGSAARMAGSGLGRATGALAAGAAAGLGSLGRRLGTALATTIDLLGRPGVGGPLTFIGLIAAFAGIARGLLGTSGFDAEAIAALGLAGLCMALGIGPALWLGHAAMPTRLVAPVTDLPTRPWLIGGGAVAVALLGAIGFTVIPGSPGLPSLANHLPALPFASAETVSGRASVIAADLLRIGDRKVRLEGIEPPDANQRCLRPGARPGGRTWPCGQDAREAMQRLVQGQQVTCKVGGKDKAGSVSGRCRVKDADLGEMLVKAGNVFADAGLMALYRGAEDAAKASKSGLWNSPEPERPAIWRDRLWAAAKREAPDGCPIKGRVQGDERVYLLPWESNYTRVRVRKGRGERWFCTQDEAEAAGWRKAQNS
jgi:endonuclease YncB( thermonuclease family)